MLESHHVAPCSLLYKALEVLLLLFKQTFPRASECSYALLRSEHPPVTCFAAHPDHLLIFPAFCRGSPVDVSEAHSLPSGRRPGPCHGAELAARAGSSPQPPLAMTGPCSHRSRPEATHGPCRMFLGNAPG